MTASEAAMLSRLSLYGDGNAGSMSCSARLTASSTSSNWATSSSTVRCRCPGEAGCGAAYSGGSSAPSKERRVSERVSDNKQSHESRLTLRRVFVVVLAGLHGNVLFRRYGQGTAVCLKYRFVLRRHAVALDCSLQSSRQLGV